MKLDFKEKENCYVISFRNYKMFHVEHFQSAGILMTYIRLKDMGKGYYSLISSKDFTRSGVI